MTLIALGLSSSFTGPSIHDMILAQHGEDLHVTSLSRKLKENRFDTSFKTTDVRDLDDYSSIDPVPNARVSVKPQPIEHRNPIIPNIPNLPPPPPGNPKPGEFP